VTELAAVVEPKFSARVLHDGEHVILRLAGNADVGAKHHLANIFRTVHVRAQELKATAVKIDMRELVFMNSSCFKDLITWLDNVRDTGANLYRIVFLSSATMHWQRRSLHALSCFARDLITVEAT